MRTKTSPFALGDALSLSYTVTVPCYSVITVIKNSIYFPPPALGVFFQ